MMQTHYRIDEKQSSLEKGLCLKSDKMNNNCGRKRDLYKKVAQCMKIILYIHLILVSTWMSYAIWQTYRLRPDDCLQTSDTISQASRDVIAASKQTTSQNNQLNVQSTTEASNEATEASLGLNEQHELEMTGGVRAKEMPNDPFGNTENRIPDKETISMNLGDYIREILTRYMPSSSNQSSDPDQNASDEVDPHDLESSPAPIDTLRENSESKDSFAQSASANDDTSLNYSDTDVGIDDNASKFGLTEITDDYASDMSGIFDYEDAELDDINQYDSLFFPLEISNTRLFRYEYGMMSVCNATLAAPLLYELQCEPVENAAQDFRNRLTVFNLYSSVEKRINVTYSQSYPIQLCTVYKYFFDFSVVSCEQRHLSTVDFLAAEDLGSEEPKDTHSATFNTSVSIEEASATERSVSESDDVVAAGILRIYKQAIESPNLELCLIKFPKIADTFGCERADDASMKFSKIPILDKKIITDERYDSVVMICRVVSPSNPQTIWDTCTVNDLNSAEEFTLAPKQIEATSIESKYDENLSANSAGKNGWEDLASTESTPTALLTSSSQYDSDEVSSVQQENSDDAREDIRSSTLRETVPELEEAASSLPTRETSLLRYSHAGSVGHMEECDVLLRGYSVADIRNCRRVTVTYTDDSEFCIGTLLLFNSVTEETSMCLLVKADNQAVISRCCKLSDNPEVTTPEWDDKELFPESHPRYVDANYCSNFTHIYTPDIAVFGTVSTSTGPEEESILEAQTSTTMSAIASRVIDDATLKLSNNNTASPVLDDKEYVENDHRDETTMSSIRNKYETSSTSESQENRISHEELGNGVLDSLEEPDSGNIDDSQEWYDYVPRVYKRRIRPFGIRSRRAVEEKKDIDDEDVSDAVVKPKKRDEILKYILKDKKKVEVSDESDTKVEVPKNDTLDRHRAYVNFIKRLQYENGWKNRSTLFHILHHTDCFLMRRYRRALAEMSTQKQKITNDIADATSSKEEFYDKIRAKALCLKGGDQNSVHCRKYEKWRTAKKLVN